MTINIEDVVTARFCEQTRKLEFFDKEGNGYLAAEVEGLDDDFKQDFSQADNEELADILLDVLMGNELGYCLDASGRPDTPKNWAK